MFLVLSSNDFFVAAFLFVLVSCCFRLFMAQFYTNNDPWDGKLKIATVSLTSSNIDEIVKVWENCSGLFLFISEHIPPL
jgi:hypothetical protein